VNWYVFSKPQELDDDQLEFFTSHWADDFLFANGRGNNRAVQDLGDRKVWISGSKYMNSADFSQVLLALSAVLLGTLF
jgi:hypothetical protein